jgi:hypothetical protein
MLHKPDAAQSGTTTDGPGGRLERKGRRSMPADEAMILLRVQYTLENPSGAVWMLDGLTAEADHGADGHG